MNGPLPFKSGLEASVAPQILALGLDLYSSQGPSVCVFAPPFLATGLDPLRPSSYPRVGLVQLVSMSGLSGRQIGSYVCGSNSDSKSGFILSSRV